MKRLVHTKGRGFNRAGNGVSRTSLFRIANGAVKTVPFRLD